MVIADLNLERGEALAAKLGDRATFVQADVTDEDSVKAAVESAAGADGGLRISVCCAGIGWAQRTTGKQGPHDLEVFSNVIKVNLIGTFNVLRLAATAMNENDPDPGGERGVCVNTSSDAAFEGQIGQVVYSASKGGIVGIRCRRRATSRAAASASPRSPRASSTPRCSGRFRMRRAPSSASRRRSRPASAHPRSTPSSSSRWSRTRC